MGPTSDGRLLLSLLRFGLLCRLPFGVPLVFIGCCVSCDYERVDVVRVAEDLYSWDGFGFGVSELYLLLFVVWRVYARLPSALLTGRAVKMRNMTGCLVGYLGPYVLFLWWFCPIVWGMKVRGAEPVEWGVGRGWCGTVVETS